MDIRFKIGVKINGTKEKVPIYVGGKMIVQSTRTIHLRRQRMVC